MPTGLELLLPLLAGASRSALSNPVLQDLTQGRTPTFIPPAAPVPLSTQAISDPLTPPRLEQLPTGTLTADALANLQAVLSGGPEQVPAPPPLTRGQRILEAIPDALAIFTQGLNPQAGAAALNAIQFGREVRRQEQVAERERKQRALDQAFQRQVVGAQVFLDTARSEDAEARAYNRELRQYMERQREILGDQAFRRNEANLQRMFEEKKQQELIQANAELEKQRRKSDFNKLLQDQIKFYRTNGVSSSATARKLALNDLQDEARELGIEVPTLTKGEDRQLDLVNARLMRLQRQGSGGGGRSGGGGKVQSWIEFTNGDIVEADKVNLDRLPVGAQVKRMFSTVGGQEFRRDSAPAMGNAASPAPSVNLEELKQRMFRTVQERKNEGATFGQILNEIRSAKAPTGVSPQDWRNLQNYSIVNLQEQFGYRKPAGPRKDPIESLPRSAIK